MTTERANLADLDALAAEEPFVRALAKSLLFDDASVDDVVQQTWLEALRHGVPGGDARRGWLARVVRSRASNERRGRARRDARERAAARPEAVASPTEMLERAEQRHVVVAAVAALAEPYRTAVMLRWFEGLPPHAIARAQRIPVDTVQTRLKRARAMLRERLDRAHGGDRRAWQLALVPFAAAHVAQHGSVLAWLSPFLVIPAVKTLVLLLCVALASLFLWNAFADPWSSPTVVDVADERADAPSASLPVARADGAAANVATRAPVAVDTATTPLIPAGLDASQRATLSGRLVDVVGAPAAGRAVRLYSVDPVRGPSGGFDPRQPADAAFIGVHDTQCDADGVFRFADVPAGQSHALWLGHGAANARLHVVPFALPAGRATDLGTLALAPRGAITGRVVDGAGAPIEGARVRAIDAPGMMLALAPVDRLDVGGALLLAVPSPDAFVRRPDGASAYAAAVRSALSAEVPTAAPDSHYVVLPFPPFVDALLAALPIPQAVTGADGRFRIEGLVDGDHALLVDAAAHARAVRPRVPLRAGELRDAGDVRMHAGATLRCNVVDESGAPVAGAEVRVALRPAFGLTGMLFADPARTTDASGACTFDRLPRGRYVVAFRRSPGHAWRTDVTANADSDVTLTLPATHDLVVRLVDGDGAPIDGARFVAHAGPWLGEATVAGLHEPLALDVRSDTAAPGVHRLVGLAPGVITLGVEAPGRAFTQTAIDVGPETGEVVVKLDPGVDCEVTVVDDAGAPVPGAEVYVTAAADESAAFSRSILHGYGGFSSWPRLVRSGPRTDADGRTRIPSLATGAAKVLVRHRARGNVVVEFASLPASVRIAMPRPGSIAGTVRDSGAVVDPATLRLDVRLASAGATFPRAPHGVRIDANGDFVVDGLSPGNYELTLEPQPPTPDLGIGAMLRRAMPTGWGYPSPDKTNVDVVAGATTRVALDLDPLAAAPGVTAASLQGRVVLDGVGVAGAEIRAESSRVGAAAARAFAVTGPDGSWSRSGVAPGPLQLSVRLADSPWTTWTMDAVASTTPTNVDFVTATATLVVDVKTAAGAAAIGSEVVASGAADAGGQVLARGKTDEAGRARLRLPRGDYALFVDGRDGHAKIPAAPLHDDTTRSVVLSEDGLLRARLEVDDDVEVSVVTLLRTSSQQWSVRSASVRDSRTFTMRGVEKGPWRVELRTRAGTFHGDPATIDIAERGPTDVVLRLGARKQE